MEREEAELSDPLAGDDNNQEPKNRCDQTIDMFETLDQE